MHKLCVYIIYVCVCLLSIVGPGVLNRCSDMFCNCVVVDTANKRKSHTHTHIIFVFKSLPSHTDAVPSSLGRGRPVGDEEEEDVEMTQQQINTKCPYTGKEMVDPVRNTICKHSYDKAGIMHYIKQRGKKAV